MALEVGPGQAEGAEPGGKRAPGVLAGEEERRGARGTHDLHWLRIAVAEQTAAAVNPWIH